MKVLFYDSHHFLDCASYWLISSLIIIIDIIKHPQKMFIMNIVWPINGWFLGPVALWTYFKWGRINAKNLNLEDTRSNSAKIFVSTSHCSAGCTAGDALGVPIVAITALTVAGSTLLARSEEHTSELQSRG